MTAPSAYSVQAAVSAYQAARAQLLTEDPDADVDAALGRECDDVDELLHRLLAAAQLSEANADAAKMMAENLTARRKRFESAKDAARATIQAIMEAIGSKKKVLPHGTISISAGRPSVVITDENAVPDEYTTPVPATRKVNKDALAADLKEGVVIEGACLSNARPVLTIRSA